ncbi:MAG TPA: regulatory protein RecX [Cyclobacteriaceae bacterium]
MRSEVQEKIMRYCAYQERCHSEVRRKLSELGVSGDEADEIIVSLIKEGFLNEERFARLFAHGKFRLKRWGRLKIVRELEMRGLTQACIKSGLQMIDEEEYGKTLEYLISRKQGEYGEENIFVKRDKIADYLIRKGFEPDLVWDALKKLVPNP